MVDLTDGHAIETDLTKPSDTAKLAMFGLVSGGVRFIIMEHPSNKQLAHVDIDADGTPAVIAGLVRLCLPAGAGCGRYDWTDEALANANDATAAAGSKATSIFSGNQINALICEVQAWRRANPGIDFMSGPNRLEPKPFTPDPYVKANTKTAE